MHKRIIISLVSVVMFMEFLDTTIINTAIPTIAKSFNQDPLLLKFAVTSYFLSLAIFTPISAWVADKLGTQKVFVLSVALFVIASFFCAISKNIPELTCFRFLQGMGGAFMNPVSRIIILRMFPAKELVRVQGFIFTPAMLGFVLGPFLGGLITTYLNWSWIFYINIPIGLAVIYFGLKYIPQQKDEKSKKFDLLGFILSALSLGCVSFSVDMVGHYDIVPKIIVIITGIMGAILLISLIYHCIRKKNPVLNFILFKIKTYRIGVSASFGSYMIVSSISFLLPLMYQEQFGYSPAYSGLLVLPIAFGQLIFRFFATRIIHKLGFKISMIYSMLITIISIVLMAQFYAHTSTIFILSASFLFGSSLIIHGSSTGALSYIDLSKEFSSPGTALDLTMRQFAASIGIGLSALFINFFRQAFSLNLSSSGGIKIFHYTFILIAFFGIFSLLHAFQLTRNEGAHALKK